MEFVDVPAIFSSLIKPLEVHLLSVHFQKGCLDLFKVFLFVWNLAFKHEWCTVISLFFFKLRLILNIKALAKLVSFGRRRHLHLYQHILVGINNITELGFEIGHLFLEILNLIIFGCLNVSGVRLKII